jgi:hypothetical protein
MLRSPELCIYVDLKDKIEHTASVYAGFEELARTGEIKLHSKKRPPFLDFLCDDDGLVICGTLKVSLERPEIKFVVDLKDSSDLIDERCLNWSNVYFKRSIRKNPGRTNCHTTQPAKIVPFGINFAARSPLMSLGARRVLMRLISGDPMACLKKVRTYLSLPSSGLFEQTAQAKLSPAIVYQTRLWTEEELNLSKSWDLNQRRVDLVAALKDRFGPQFKGGLMPTPLIKESYPTLVSNIPSNRRSYAQVAKRHLIGVYAEGLSSSTAFKFLEYLAGAQCIVAEKLANELPVQCLEKVNYLSFSSPNECVLHCERLLSHTAEAQEMRLQNELLYKTVVSPAARGRYVLEQLRSLNPP